MSQLKYGLLLQPFHVEKFNGVPSSSDLIVCWSTTQVAERDSHHIDEHDGREAKVSHGAFAEKASTAETSRKKPTVPD
jgi:hypothetical protein